MRRGGFKRGRGLVRAGGRMSRDSIRGWKSERFCEIIEIHKAKDYGIKSHLSFLQTLECKHRGTAIDFGRTKEREV